MFTRNDPSEEVAAHDLAFKLQNLRAQKGATQKQIADLVGVDESTIRNYELARRTPKPEHLAALAEALGVAPEAMKIYDVRVLPEETIHAFVQLGETYGFEPGGDERFAYLKPTNRFTETSVRRWAERFNFLMEDGEEGRVVYELWKDNFREPFMPADFPARYPDYDPADATAGTRWSADKLSAKLQGLRAQHGWSQVDLAAESGLSKSAIRSYEQGTRMPKAAQRLTLAQTFDVGPAALLFYDFGNPNQAIHALFQFAGSCYMHPVIDEDLGPIVRTYQPMMHWWMLQWCKAYQECRTAGSTEAAKEAYESLLDALSSDSEASRIEKPEWIEDHYKRVYPVSNKADEYYWVNEFNPEPLCNVKA